MGLKWVVGCFLLVGVERGRRRGREWRWTGIGLGGGGFFCFLFLFLHPLVSLGEAFVCMLWDVGMGMVFVFLPGLSIHGRIRGYAVSR